MSRTRRFLRALLPLGVLALAACGESYDGPAVTVPSAGRLVISNVTVVDTRNGLLLPEMSVVMAQGVITAVVPVDVVGSDPDMLQVDGSGRYLVPGFNDMHAHPLGHGDPTDDLVLMLANGITGFRQMAGSAAMLEARREHRLPLTENAPALLALPGQLLNPFSASDNEDTAATVARQQIEGADFIKVGMVGPEAFFAALAEAERLQLPVAGHVPHGVSTLDASRAGLRSIEHLGPGNGVLINCTARPMAFLEGSGTMPAWLLDPPKIPFGEDLMMILLKTVVINPSAGTDHAEIQAVGEMLSLYDESECRRAAGIYIANDTWQVPTLIRLKTTQLAFLPEFREDEAAARYISGEVRNTWTAITDKYSDGLSADDRNILREAYTLSQRIVGLMDREGVRMLTGSDSTGGGWLVPGFALHREFDELAEAGISPLRVLQMTTVDAAEFLGRADTMGAVEPGKQADLVLLNANPLADVANLHDIDAVVRAGIYHSRADLDALLAGVEAETVDDR